MMLDDVVEKVARIIVAPIMDALLLGSLWVLLPAIGSIGGASGASAAAVVVSERASERADLRSCGTFIQPKTCLLERSGRPARAQRRRPHSFAGC
jgi:hypothetical protein